MSALPAFLPVREAPRGAWRAARGAVFVSWIPERKPQAMAHRSRSLTIERFSRVLLALESLKIYMYMYICVYIHVYIYIYMCTFALSLFSCVAAFFRRAGGINMMCASDMPGGAINTLFGDSHGKAADGA